jgi:tRNA (cmo5U34)-methyltransferase
VSAQDEGNGFSFSTIKDFDVHIAREVRGYEILDNIVSRMADAFIEADTNVYDIGCSTGRLINTLAASLAAETDESRRRRVTFIGIDPSAHFANTFKPASESVCYRLERVTDDTQFGNASLITAIFTLQFIATQERAAIIRNIHDGLNSNGAFILAERVHASDARIERILNDIHTDFKREGSSAEDILDKDRRLRAVMRPLSLTANCRMLEAAGFTRYELFWRVNNFIGIVAIKS